MPDVRMPDGTIIRNVPEGTTRAQLQEKIAQSKKPTSFLQGVAEGALPAVTNIAKAMQYVNPFLVGTKAASRVMGTPDVYSEKVKAGNAKVKGALSRTGYRGSTVVHCSMRMALSAVSCVMRRSAALLARSVMWSASGWSLLLLNVLAARLRLELSPIA
jgi:hypothetical protein